MTDADVDDTRISPALTASVTPTWTHMPRPTSTSILTKTAIATAAPTSTPLLPDTPTATRTPTGMPVATNTSVPPTNTPLPPMNTPMPATSTSVPTVANVRIVGVYNRSKTEYVRLANQGTAAQDMGGWSVSGSKGDERYVFPGGYVLAAGAGVRLHSGTGGIDAPPADIYWTTKNVWNNDGETVYLWNAQSAQVDSYTY